MNKKGINENLFCSADYWDTWEGGICKDPCHSGPKCDKDPSQCKHCHRKYPTPEQFCEEYGEKVPDTFPVWWRWWFWNNQECTEGEWEDWRLARFGDLPTATKTRDPDKCQIVCACSPWTEPPTEWRQE